MCEENAIFWVLLFWGTVLKKSNKSRTGLGQLIERTALKWPILMKPLNVTFVKKLTRHEKFFGRDRSISSPNLHTSKRSRPPEVRSNKVITSYALLVGGGVQIITFYPKSIYFPFDLLSVSQEGYQKLRKSEDWVNCRHFQTSIPDFTFETEQNPTVTIADWKRDHSKNLSLRENYMLSISYFT